MDFKSIKNLICNAMLYYIMRDFVFSVFHCLYFKYAQALKKLNISKQSHLINEYQICEMRKTWNDFSKHTYKLLC